MVDSTDAMVERLKALLGDNEISESATSETSNKPPKPSHDIDQAVELPTDTANSQSAEDVEGFEAESNEGVSLKFSAESSTDHAVIIDSTAAKDASESDESGSGDSDDEYSTSTLPPVLGQAAPCRMAFTPVVAASKIPYKFIKQKNLSERVANAFFNDGRFWRREWAIYYIWSPNANMAKPLLLIPASEVDDLLNEINGSIKNAALSLGEMEKREPSIQIRFPYGYTSLRPRYLGKSRSRDDYNRLSDNRPGEAYLPPGAKADDKSLDSYQSQANDCRYKIGLAGDSVPAVRKSHATPQQQQAREKEFEHGLLTLERFFGLRPAKYSAPSSSDEWQELSWEESQARDNAKKALKHTPPINPTMAAPYDFDSSVVFISVDIEWYERDQNKITEIGISTLDTRDLHGVAPGLHGANWYTYVRHRHFRIAENSHLVNTEFVQGCPTAFQFGSSEFIRSADMPKVIASCFQPPYSAREGHRSDDEMYQTRTLVVVGHGVMTDIKMLRKHGYDMLNHTMLHPVWPLADTQRYYRTFKKQQEPAKLAAVLYDFDIIAFGLHNAGNDAAYTMQALIAIAVDSAASRNAAEAGSSQAGVE